MEKRFLLAFGLSFLVLMAYSSFFQKKQLIENKEVVSNQIHTVTQPTDVLPEIPPPTSLPSPANSDEINGNMLCPTNLKIIESDGFILKFSKKGGFLYEVFDKKNNITMPMKFIGLVKEWAEYDFVISELPKGIVFSYIDDDGREIKKTYRIKPDNGLELTVNISNVTNSKLTSYKINAGYFSPSEARDAISSRYYEVSVMVNEVLTRKSIYGLKNAYGYEGNIGWIGLRDRYFCSVFFPQFKVNNAVIEIYGQGYNSVLLIPERIHGQGLGAVEDQYRIYIGAQDISSLKMFALGTEQIVNFGTFDSIAKILLFLLEKTQSIVKNWGWSIIIVTILVYFLLFPLSWKSMLSMKKMQAIQPLVEEVRAKHKANPQKLNSEIMELYKREKVNPFGGCLPMILQIPVFFSLYQLLMRFISLRGAHFLWIKDLSEPDRFMIFKPVLPVVGNELNILPILMAVGMFFQQKLTAVQAGKDSATAEQQKIMSIVMPIMFGVLFYKMSSGLVLYWFVNNLLMVIFQWTISRRKTT